MNKIIVGLILAASISFANNSMEEVVKFANEICGSINLNGKMEKIDIDIHFTDKNKKELIQLLKDMGFEDVEIRDNRIIKRRYSYKGIPREKISQSMKEIRKCKMDIVKSMMQ